MLTLTHLVQLAIRKIMQQTLHDHHTTISTGDRPICNLQFWPTTLILWGGSNGELKDLTNRLVDGARANGMGVSTEKSKIMTNSTKNISADISMNG